MTSSEYILKTCHVALSSGSHSLVPKAKLTHLLRTRSAMFLLLDIKSIHQERSFQQKIHYFTKGAIWPD